MHRAFVCDLEQAPAHGVVEGPGQLQGALDLIEAALFGFAVGAVRRVNPAVAQSHRDPLERQLLALGIEA
jgi:hypothetical protein